MGEDQEKKREGADATGAFGRPVLDHCSSEQDSKFVSLITSVSKCCNQGKS